uniref:BZIP domain-containing protein n=1 Tax=Strigamia maritima TaxID=126957 RepID=T1IP37_STRMM
MRKENGELEAEESGKGMSQRIRDGDKKDNNWDESFDSTSGYLNPIWDKSISSYQEEFKMEYVDLDEFFTENGMSIPTSDLAAMKASPGPGPGPGPQQLHHHHHHHQATQSQSASAPPAEKPPAQPSVHSPPMPPSLPSPPTQQSLPPFDKPVEIKSEPVSDSDMLYGKLPCENDHHSYRTENDCKVLKVELKFSPADLALANSPGEESFDPKSHTFSEEELKPQPMVKKSRKQFVPDDMKDDRYWARRRKNNLAAKRSRDARRVKENQIALRASFLEKENFTLKKEVDVLRKENSILKIKLSKMEEC